MTLLHFKFPCVAVSVTCSWFAHASWVTYDTCVVSFFFFCFLFWFDVECSIYFTIEVSSEPNSLCCYEHPAFWKPIFFSSKGSLKCSLLFVKLKT